MEYSFKEIKQCETCGKEEFYFLGIRLNKHQGLSPRRKRGIGIPIVKCRNCNLVFPNPMPIPKSITQHYGKPAEDYWKPEYFVISENYFKSEIETVKGLLDLKQGMTALDIGAGIGKGMVSLLKNGWEVYGIEPSKEFYEKAISKFEIDKNRFFNLPLEKASFEDNMFDFITYGAVFEHLYNPFELLEKSLGWLRKGGGIHIEVPSSDWFIGKIFNFYYKIIGTNFVTNLSPMHTPYHIYEFHLDSFKEISNRLGLSIVKHDYQVCSIPYVPKVFHPILKKYMHLTNQGMQLCIYLKKN